MKDFKTIADCVNKFPNCFDIACVVYKTSGDVMIIRFFSID